MWPVGAFKMIHHLIPKTRHHIFHTSLESNGTKVNRLSRRMLQSYKYMSLFYSFISNNTYLFDFCVRYYRNKYRSYCKCKDKSLGSYSIGGREGGGWRRGGYILKELKSKYGGVLLWRYPVNDWSMHDFSCSHLCSQIIASPVELRCRSLRLSRGVGWRVKVLPDTPLQEYIYI